MITVYGALPTRALRVLWMLEEMGLDYEIHPVDFARRLDDAEFVAASHAKIGCSARPAEPDSFCGGPGVYRSGHIVRLRGRTCAVPRMRRAA
jgi:hypothetical protein